MANADRKATPTFINLPVDQVNQLYDRASEPIRIIVSALLEGFDRKEDMGYDPKFYPEDIRSLVEIFTGLMEAGQKEPWKKAANGTEI